MSELQAILLSWAVTLSGYPAPAQPPTIMSVPSAVLRAAACGGDPCQVLGWHPPGRVIYLDDRLDPARDLLAASVLVHEAVHYLQQESGRFGAGHDCASVWTREIEAYGVQREFLHRYGVYRPVGLAMMRTACEEGAP